MKIYSLLIVLLLLACEPKKEVFDVDKEKKSNTTDKRIQAYSIDNRPLYASEPSQIIIDKFLIKKQKYEADPEKIDNIIWYGRFLAYQGKYKEAIQVYSDGIEINPMKPRLLRHRGHRFITVRKFDRAISDLELAKKAIQGKVDIVEQDGLPNSKNIPVSTLNTNIYYHLGLAYYLKGDYRSAANAYIEGLKFASNDDMKVAFIHWAYMTFRRLNDIKQAQKMLDPVHIDMNIIESFAYFKLCLLYKGIISLESIETEINSESLGANAALKYGLANRLNYNNNIQESLQAFDKIIKEEDWAAFGTIAAEVDLYTIRN